MPHVHSGAYIEFKGFVFRLDSCCFAIFSLVCFGLLGMFLDFLRLASDRGVVTVTHPPTDMRHVEER